MENYKKTVIENTNLNGVFHIVKIYLDGTITATKFINGSAVQEYDWSFMSTNEVYETARESGHQRYTIIEEMPARIEFNYEQREIREMIKKAIDGNLSKEIKVAFDTQVEDGNVDVSVVVYVNGEMALDEIVATTKNVTNTNIEIAKQMRDRLEKRYSKRFSTVGPEKGAVEE